MARRLAEPMAARGAGHLVFVSSLSGKVASGGGSVYAATKFGLRGFAHGLREDLRGSGVGVSVVLPGLHPRQRACSTTPASKLPALRRHQARPRTSRAAVVRAIERDRARDRRRAAGRCARAPRSPGSRPSSPRGVQRRLGGAEGRRRDGARPARQARLARPPASRRRRSVARRLAGDLGARPARISSASCGPSRSSTGVAVDAHDDLVGVELLERDRGARRAPASGRRPRAAPGRRSGARRGAAARAGRRAAGSRSGTTAAVSTTLLGTMIESWPCAKVV